MNEKAIRIFGLVGGLAVFTLLLFYWPLLRNASVSNECADPHLAVQYTGFAMTHRMMGLPVASKEDIQRMRTFEGEIADECLKRAVRHAADFWERDKAENERLGKLNASAEAEARPPQRSR